MRSQLPIENSGVVHSLGQLHFIKNIHEDCESQGLFLLSVR